MISVPFDTRVADLLDAARTASRWSVAVRMEELEPGEFVHVFRVSGMSRSRARSVCDAVRRRLSKYCWDHWIVPSFVVEAVPRVPRRRSRAGSAHARRSA